MRIYENREAFLNAFDQMENLFRKAVTESEEKANLLCERYQKILDKKNLENLVNL